MTRLVTAIGGFLGRMALWSVSLLALMVLGLMIRLMLGPLDVGFAQDRILSTLNQTLPNWQSSYRTASLAWEWKRFGPVLRLQKIDLKNQKIGLVARFGHADLILAQSILSGILDLRVAHISDVSATITAAGRERLNAPRRQKIEYRVAEESPANASFFSGAPQQAIRVITEDVFALADRLDIVFPDLDSVSVESASLIIESEKPEQVIKATIPRLTLDLSGTDITVDAQLDLLIDGRRSGFNGGIAMDRATQSIDLDIHVEGVRPDRLVDPYGLPDSIRIAQLPLSLSLQAQVDQKEGLRTARFIIDVGTGALVDDSAYPETAPISLGQISGRFDPKSETLFLDDISLTLSGRVLSAKGTAQWVAGRQQPSLDLTASVDEISIKQVLRYWPIRREADGRERGGRSWVARNMIGGMAENVEFRIQTDAEGQGAYLKGSPFRLDFTYRDLDTYILSAMPPVVDASGRAWLTQTTLDIQVDKAVIEDASITGGSIVLNNLHRLAETDLTVQASVEGPVPDILNVLDYRPIALGDKLKTDLTRFSGQAKATAEVKVPLSSREASQNVVYQVEGHVTDFGFQDLLGGEGIRQGDLDLTLDNDEFTARGRVALNGVPADVYWVEDIALAQQDLKADTSHLTAHIEASVSDLEAIQLQLGRYGSGPFSADVVLTGRSAQFDEARIEADVSTARLMVPELGWVRDAGPKARLSGHVGFTDQETKLMTLDLTGDAIDASLTGTIGRGDAAPLDLRARVNQLGENKLLSRVKTRDDGVLDVVVDADRLDLRPFIQPAQDGQSDSETQATPDIDLDLTSQSLVFLNGEEADDVTLQATFREGEPKEAEARMVTRSSRAPVLLKIDAAEKPEPPLGQAVWVETTDGGFLMRGMGFFSHILGGDLIFSGRTGGFARTLALDVRGSMKTARVVRSVDLPETATIGILPNLDGYIGEKGVKLSDADMPLTYKEGMIDFKGMTANGPSLGVTLEGEIDSRTDLININGVVVPAYTLNALLGKIPIIGPLFSGGKGGGLFAVPYRVKGQMENPDVTVSAASTIMPGFLRTIFSGRKGAVSDLPEEMRKEAEAASKAAKDVAEAPPKQTPKDPSKEKQAGDGANGEAPKPDPEKNGS